MEWNRPLDPGDKGPASGERPFGRTTLRLAAIAGIALLVLAALIVF